MRARDATQKRCPPTHEEILCVGRVAADAEELHQVVELAVDITAYLGTHQRRVRGVSQNSPYRHGRRNRHDVTLLDQQFSRLVADLADLGLGDRFACAQLRDGPRTMRVSYFGIRRPTGRRAIKGGGAYLSRSLMAAIGIVSQSQRRPKKTWRGGRGRAGQ